MRVYCKVDTTPMWVMHHVGTLYEVSYACRLINFIYCFDNNYLNIILTIYRIGILYEVSNTHDFIYVVLIIIHGHYTMVLAAFYMYLTGTYDKDGTESGGTIGWSVTYNNSAHGNSKSTATWSGQRQLGFNSNPIIQTTWLLTSQTVPSKSWESTLTNQDLFQRLFPKDEKIRATLIARNFKEHTC